MRKKSFIAGILVFSMLLMGTGYAYWTQKLTINSTVSTGDMTVRFIDLALYGQYDEMGWSVVDGIVDLDGATDGSLPFEGTSRDFNTLGDETKIGDYKNLLAKWSKTDFDAQLGESKGIEDVLGNHVDPAYYNDGNFKAGSEVSENINITLTNIYPGYAQAFRTDIVNLGTITAKLAAIQATVEGTNLENADEMIGVAMHVYREKEDSNGNSDVDVLTSLLPQDNTFEVGGVQFVRLADLQKLYTAFENKEIFVQPNDNRFDVYLAFAMDPDYDGVYTTGHVDTTKSDSTISDELSQEKSVTVSLDFYWDQFNTSVNGESLTPNSKLPASSLTQ